MCKGVMILLLSVIATTASAATNVYSHALERACKTLLASPTDRGSLSELAAFSVDAEAKASLRSQAMAVCALSALSAQDTNTYLRIQRIYDASFPDDQRSHLIDLNNCYRLCGTCAGNGHIDSDIQCAQCKGEGRCMSNACKDGKKVILVPSKGGTKRVTSVLSCQFCGGSGICPRCKGKKILRSVCQACQGQRASFVVPQSVGQEQRALLRSLLSALNLERGFETAYGLILSETNLASRAEACRETLTSFSSHPRAAEVRRLLRDAESSLTQTADDARQREAKLRNDMSVIRQQMSRNPKAAYTTINEYIRRNGPDLKDTYGATCAIELEGMLNECRERIASGAERKKLLYVLGIVLVVLFGVSCVNISIYRFNLLPPNMQIGRRRYKAASAPPPEPPSDCAS